MNKIKGKGENSPMNVAVRYLASKPRTVKETAQYLDERGFGEYEISATLDRLLELNYLDDTAYAARFASGRLSAKPISRGRLLEQLTRHGVDQDAARAAVDEALPEDDEFAGACRTAREFLVRFAELPPRIRYERAARRLYGRGYEPDVVSRALYDAGFDKPEVLWEGE